VPGAPGASAKGAAVTGAGATSAAAAANATIARRLFGDFIAVLPTGFVDGRICC